MATLSRGGGISPELGELLSANPLDDNSWQEISYTNQYDKLVYDNVNDIYYGIKTSTTTKYTVQIYKLTADSETLVGSKSFTITDTPVNSSFGYSSSSNRIIIVINGYGLNGVSSRSTLIQEFSTISNTFMTVYIKLTNTNGGELTNIASEDYLMFVINRYLILLYNVYDLFIYDLNEIVYPAGTTLNPICYNCLQADISADSETFRLISVVESKKYIAININGERYYSEDDYTISDSSCYLFDKDSRSIMSYIVSTYNNDGISYYINHFSHAVSCYDYENNKFLICHCCRSDSDGIIYDLDGSSSFQKISKSCGSYLYRILTINEKLYTLLFTDTNIYIREGYDWATITDLSSYTLLNNVACDSYRSTRNIYEGWNQLSYSHKSLIFKVDTGSSTAPKYYGFINQGCLPVIDEEGYNAFIKISD